MDLTMTTSSSLKGEVKIPGDKSIAHRAIILNAIADGISRIDNFPLGGDCLNTIGAMRNLGVPIDVDLKKARVIVYGQGLRGLKMPSHPIDVGNSGTTGRLLIGLLSGQGFTSTITGDRYLVKRPMDRIVIPLTKMGASIHYEEGIGTLPVYIYPSDLNGIDYTMPIASAQVKSAILLATLYAKSPTIIRGDRKSRNHTELMLKNMGANIITSNDSIFLEPADSLFARNVYVPCDISSASFFITGAMLVPNSSILIKDVGLNTTRSGILDVYKDMGADVSIENTGFTSGELKGDIIVSSKHPLRPTIIDKNLVPRLIDEIPIIALAATQAKGKTIIKDAHELAVKESNRIQSTADVLLRLGANISPTSDGMIIEGPTPLYGAAVDSMGDHRIAMMAAIAGLIAKGKTTIKNSQWIDISFPDFFEILGRLTNSHA